MNEPAKEAMKGTEVIAQFLILGGFIFIGYALSFHLGWRDAIASTIAFLILMRSISRKSSK